MTWCQPFLGLCRAKEGVDGKVGSPSPRVRRGTRAGGDAQAWWPAHTVPRGQEGALQECSEAETWARSG